MISTVMLTETMYDSANIDAIPTDAKNVGYYPAFVEERVVRARFPNAQLFAISNEMPPNWAGCRIGDFELGALTWQSAHNFLTSREKFRPDTATAYASYDNLSLLRKGWGSLSFKPWVWVALWPFYPSPAEVNAINTRVTEIGGRLAAIQYFNNQTADYDLSLKNSEWKHR